MKYVSFLSVPRRSFRVRATSGDTQLGGRDFDNRLVDYCIQNFKEINGIDISFEKRALHRLRAKCEKAKRTLSLGTRAYITVDTLFGNLDYSTVVTRAVFEEINKDLFEK